MVLVIYYFSFALILLQINLIILRYIDSGLMYTVMAEHFVISFIFGYFWLKMTGIKSQYAIASVLILPTVFFSIIYINSFVLKTSSEGSLAVVQLLAISQYVGALLGIIAFYMNKGSQ